nr:CRIB domain-containing protein RIC6-like [Malus domestica]
MAAKDAKNSKMVVKDANNGKMVVKDANNNKMKGLLKGLRYISQIFDDNKDQEMQIGLPTDVKHVAHIGWDGPSTASSPSWMNEFQAPPGFQQSAPLGNGDMKEDYGVKWVSEDFKPEKFKGC